MARRVSSALPLLLVACAAAQAPGLDAWAAKPRKVKARVDKTAETQEDKAFRERLGALTRDPANLIVIQMAATDDPAAIPGSASSTGLVMVAGNRQIEVPDQLSPEDIRAVVGEHVVEVKRCFKKQLESDPEWDDALILDLAIRKTGRVSEVSIAPRRVQRDVIGVCLMSTVPKWRFPAFTGETEDGVTQEVVTASFPFKLTSR